MSRDAIPALGPEGAETADDLLGIGEGGLLDLVDHLLNQGVVLRAEVVLGLAGVDLVYLQLSALLCAADRVLGPREP